MLRTHATHRYHAKERTVRDAKPCDTGAIRRRAATACAFALAVAAVTPGAPAQAAAAAWEARVVRVSDGDTLWVRPLAGGRATKLRIDGIDAPELCQRGGRESRRALQHLVLQHTVRVDVAARDNYGRGIARVELAGQDVGERLVRDGHAWNDRFRFHVGPYAEQEAQARAARRGVFADPAAVEPREFRRVHGPCTR
jgi:endonuclease YncB( thermonuclease family)